MMWGKLLLSYVGEAQHQYRSTMGENGTKVPDHARAGGCYALACPESHVVATVYLVQGYQNADCVCKAASQCTICCLNNSHEKLNILNFVTSVNMKNDDIEDFKM